jgi:uncharacterized protein YlaN (UPF0358 family)
LPAPYVKQAKEVNREAAKLVGMSEQNAQYRFIQLAKSLNSYGSTSFSCGKGKKLTISPNRIQISDSKGMQDYKLTDVRRWSATEKKFTLDLGDHANEYIQLETKDAEQISQLVSGYIDIQLKKRTDAIEPVPNHVATSLNSYGSTSFSCGKGKKLTISPNSIQISDSKGTQDYKLTDVRRWSATEKMFTLDLGDHASEYIQLETKDAEQISQLVSGYIDVQLKKRIDPVEPIPDQGTVAVPVPSKYQNLIGLCKARGYWELDKALADILGLSLEKMKNSVPLDLKNKISDEDILLKYWATCIVIVVLENEFKDKSNEWFMIVSKANGWLSPYEPNTTVYKELAKSIVNKH